MSTLSRLIDSASEGEGYMEDADVMLTPDSAVENVAPKRKPGRPKAAATKVTKPRATRRTSGPSAGTAKRGRAPAKTTKGKRGALKEQVNEEHASDTEVVDEFEGQPAANDDDQAMSVVSVDELDEPTPPVKQTARKGRQPKTQSTASKAKTSKGKVAGETPDIARQAKSSSRPASTVKPPAHKRQPSVEPERRGRVVPDSQPMPIEVDQSTIYEEAESEPTPRPVERHTSRAPSVTRSRPPSVPRRRAGSASDTERGSDPMVRRKLGEITRKFENLDLKYRNLRDAGVKEAEVNFERLKASSEARSKAANNLIASLKKDLATQTALAQQSRSLQQQLEDRDAEILDLQSQVSQLSSDLSTAHNDNKALSAKLAATRTAAASVQSTTTKTPGSAVKQNMPTRTVMVGSAEAAQAAQNAQLKEDLYSDLTNLILRDIKKTSEADIYDCIQTGRNGTLHFKLAIANEADSRNSGYSDAEFCYMPLLDEHRDRDLLDLLPDYLTEEINFPRHQAEAFYRRVVDALTKRRVVEE